jgi:hypothetical protein
MRFLQRAILYFIPTISILIFAYFVATAGGPHAAQWGASHGVDVAIVNNYRYVNSISLIAWIVVLAFVVAGRGALAQGTAIFGTAYALCDVVFYLPMARLAGEHFPIDQATIVGVQALYALGVRLLMSRLSRNHSHQLS